MKAYKILLTALLLSLLTGCSILSGSPAMSVSVSSDGRYVVSAHRGTKLYLWDIEAQSKTRIARDANLYSAFFIPGSDAFMWQNLDREVIVQTVEGEKVKRFALDHDVYGHVMNLERDIYVSADAEYALRVITQGEETQLKAPGGSFMGFFKVLNLSLSADASLLVTAGSGRSHRDYEITEADHNNNYNRMVGVSLWSLERLEPLAKLPGNSSKTHASISPDGQWVVSGDENGIGRFWNTNEPEERFDNAHYFGGIYGGVDESGEFKPRDRSKLIPRPSERIDDATLATLFIQNSRYYFYLSYTGREPSHPYAVLFETGNPWPIKYFHLGTNPWPSTQNYSRNLTVSTAPEAGILVTGQHSRGGINVYQFDAEALTLERIWVGR